MEEMERNEHTVCADVNCLMRFVSTAKGELADLCTTKAKTPKYIAILGSHRVLLTILSLVGCNFVLLGKQF